MIDSSQQAPIGGGDLECPAARVSLVENPSNHVCARIAQTEIIEEPFPHIYLRDVFPNKYYERILDELPADDRYEKYPPPYESRLYFNLDPATAMKLGKFWTGFESWLNSQAFLDRIAAKFAAFLPPTYKNRKLLVDKHTVGDSVKIGSRVMVTRDYGDFALGPHTDSVTKFITMIFYLPKDERFARFGTSIYRPKQAGFRAWKSPHFPHDQFSLLRTFPNVPNSLFAFVKTDNSFHGVEPGEYPNDGRNMLMWVPEIGISDRSWGELTLSRELLADGTMSHS